jgi:hypothetical protein
MALTIGEASAVFHLLKHVLGEPGPAGPITSEQALQAALLLRDKAYKTLLAGMTQDRLRELWAAYADRTEAERSGEAACVLCGCTENQACEGGCRWVPNLLMVDVCSACVEQLTAPAEATDPEPADAKTCACWEFGPCPSHGGPGETT